MKNIKSYILFLMICLTINACNNVKPLKIENPYSKNNSVTLKPQKLTPSQKAVQLAEECIARNGYTKEPADTENLSYEPINFLENDEMLESRHDTLEPKAYGYLSEGKSSEKGWTVAFRFSESRRKQNKKDKTGEKEELGRAVTMDKNFENLRVEHKDFILKFTTQLK